MAKGLINDSTLTNIADAIRAKNETTGVIRPSDMAALIAAIETGIPIPNWINEIEFGQFTVTGAYTSLKLPCAMSAAPTGHLIFPVTTEYTGSSQQAKYYEGAELKLPVFHKWYVFAGSDSPYTFHSHCKAKYTTAGAVTNMAFSDSLEGSWTLKNDGTAYYSSSMAVGKAGGTYNIIMWR